MEIGFAFENSGMKLVCLAFYTRFVLSVWLGNLVGTGLVGYAVRATRIAGIAEKAEILCQAKLNDNLLSFVVQLQVNLHCTHLLATLTSLLNLGYARC